MAAVGAEPSSTAQPRPLHTLFLRVSAFVKSSPSFLSRVLTCLLVFTFLLNLLLPPSFSSRLLALIPELAVPRLWMLLTASFYETSLPLLLVDVAAVNLVLPRVETLWGTAEMVRFTLLLAFLIGTSAFITMYLLYALTFDSYYLFATFGGFHGNVAGLLVALKQTTPDEDVSTILGLPSPSGIRCRNLASIYVGIILIFVLLSGGKHHHIGLWFYALFGTYAGFIYLRYFQQLPHMVESGAKGDSSPDFSFHTLFPSFLHPVVERLATVCHAIFCTRMRGGGVRGEEEGRGNGGDDGLLLPVSTSEGRGGDADAVEAALRKQKRSERGKLMLEKKMMKGGQEQQQQSEIAGKYTENDIGEEEKVEKESGQKDSGGTP